MLDSLLQLLWVVSKILAIVVPLILTVAYFTYAERRVIGFMQVRMGPNRVGFPFLKLRLWGLGQPFADVTKLLLKDNVGSALCLTCHDK